MFWFSMPLTPHNCTITLTDAGAPRLFFFCRGYALTMVDSLDMHAIVGDGKAFREATGTLLRDFESGLLSFDRDVDVSVFEASIRVLGGLVRKTCF